MPCCLPRRATRRWAPQRGEWPSRAAACRLPSAVQQWSRGALGAIQTAREDAQAPPPWLGFHARAASCAPAGPASPSFEPCRGRGLGIASSHLPRCEPPLGLVHGRWRRREGLPGRVAPPCGCYAPAPFSGGAREPLSAGRRHRIMPAVSLYGCQRTANSRRMAATAWIARHQPHSRSVQPWRACLRRCRPPPAVERAAAAGSSRRAAPTARLAPQQQPRVGRRCAARQAPSHVAAPPAAALTCRRRCVARPQMSDHEDHGHDVHFERCGNTRPPSLGAAAAAAAGRAAAGSGQCSRLLAAAAHAVAPLLPHPPAPCPAAPMPVPR